MTRPTWRLAKAGNDQQSGSRTGGHHWLAPGEDPPKCGECGKTMGLLIQIRCEDLPESLRGAPSGWLQLWVCSAAEDDRCHVALNEPFNKASRARWLSDGRPGAAGSWPGRGLRTSERLPDEGEGKPTSGADKLGGLPVCSWKAPVSCPRCTTSLALLLQLADNGVAGLSWGDADNAFLMYCPTHTDELTFFWAGG